MDFDVVVTGGGVAGGSCALQLARLGLSVAMYEREEFPRDKVCGEFLSPESVAQLQDMRLEEPILDSGGLRVTRAMLHSPHGHTFKLDLRHFQARADHGLAISRRRLDQLLFDSAKAAGAVCSDRIRIDCVEHDGAGQRVEGTDLRKAHKFSVTCRFFVDAAGRKSKFISHPDGRRAYFGYKTHWPEPIVPAGEVHLFFFNGGYGGATTVEQGRTCLSIMATPRLFRDARGDYSHLLAATIFQNKSACRLLAPLDPSFLRWISTGPLIFELKGISVTPWIHLGDAAGMIDPYTGEGMTFALRTASLLAKEISRGGKYAEVKERFTGNVRTELEACHRNSAKLGRIAARPWLVDRIFQMASHSRWLRRRLVTLTRAPV